MNSRWVSNDAVFDSIVGVKSCNVDAPLDRSFIILHGDGNPLMTEFLSLCRMTAHISSCL